MSPHQEHREPVPVASPMRRWSKPLIAALALGAAVIILIELRNRGLIDATELALYFQQIGALWWAPVVFIVLYSLFNILGLPGSVLTLAAGVVWGWLAGGLWVLAGSTIGTALPFLIARHGTPWAAKWVRHKGGRFVRVLQKEGFTALLMMRLLPLVPYNILNYASGLAGIRFRDYVVATFIGSVPGTFIYTYFADAIFSGLVSPQQALIRIAIAGVLLAALALGTRLLAARLRRRVVTDPPVVLAEVEQDDDDTPSGQVRSAPRRSTPSGAADRTRSRSAGER